jgi:DNA-binding Lrp family transcriptional regulator
MVLGYRRLTRRRRECLEALERIVTAAGAPAHYTAVAPALGISPWTAYDLLRELEHDGLVATTYAHRAGVAVGRPQVAFHPTAEGRRALGQRTSGGADERALRRARERVASLGQTLRPPRTLDVAGHLGFWLQQAETLPWRSRDSLVQLLRGAPEAATGLTTFVAAVYGGVTSRAGAEADDMLALVGAFQSRLARTTAARRERLVRSLLSILEPRAPASGQHGSVGFLGEN